MKIEELDMNIKTISLKPNDILVLTMQEELNRIPKSKAEEYIRNIHVFIKDIMKKAGYDNQVLVLAHGNEFSKITTEEEQ